MSKSRKTIWIVLSVALWIGIWTLLAYRLNKPVLLPYPLGVWKALLKLVRDPGFLKTLWGSFAHVSAGFLCALVLGILLAVLGSLREWIGILLMPGVKLIKTVPVVSFIILLLFFVKPAGIGFVISMLMVFPVVYENVRKGIASSDRRMLEAAKVFRLSFLKRLRYILIPTAVPYTAAACSAGLSLCWKAGIAAELIAQSPNSIGHELYYSKLYVDAESVFAWTIVIILVSVLFEKVFLFLFRLLTVAFNAPTVCADRRKFILYLLGIRVIERKHADEIQTEEDELKKDAKLPEEPANDAGEAPVVQIETDGSISGEPLLTLTGVGLRYDVKPILHNINLSLTPGSVTVVLGPSGCGKTSLLRILLGLTAPSEGERTVREGVRLSAVFQENRLCEQLSASKNTRIPGGVTKKEADELLRLSGINETEGKPVSDFSGGMKRRVAWCRALSARSEIIVLDEPFTGLDEEKKERMLRLLAEKKKQNAIVIVTHNTSEILKTEEHFPNATRLSLTENV